MPALRKEPNLTERSVPHAPPPPLTSPGLSFPGATAVTMLEVYDWIAPDGLLQRAGEAAHHPAISARPEEFAAVGFTFIEIGCVAREKMLLRIVQEIRGDPPFMIHEFEIVKVAACRAIEAREHGRRHEKRVAPPPERLIGGIGQLHEIVHAVAWLFDTYHHRPLAARP